MTLFLKNISYKNLDELGIGYISWLEKNNKETQRDLILIQ
jgi:hypothetical protein